MHRRAPGRQYDRFVVVAVYVSTAATLAKRTACLTSDRIEREKGTEKAMASVGVTNETDEAIWAAQEKAQLGHTGMAARCRRLYSMYYSVLHRTVGRTMESPAGPMTDDS